MKTFVRKVLPLLVLLIVVAVVTYFKEFTGPAPAPKGTAAVSNDAPPLIWGDRVALWDRENFRYGQEFEVKSHGHYDFWVANPSDSPTSIEVTAKSCQCSEVKLALVPPGAFKQAAQTMQTIMAARRLFGTSGFDPSGLAMAEAVQGLDWHKMDLKNTRQIPAGQLAIVRLGWEAKAVGPLYMTADLNYYGKDRKAATVKFEVPISVVNPANIYPQDVNIADLRSGDSRQMVFTIWTASRKDVPLKLPDVPKDSCFVFGEPQPLSDVERRQMEEKLHLDHPNQPPTKPVAGWKVPLTVYESYQGNQMDLGPFNRRLVFNPGTEFEVPVLVKGVVRGNISLANREAEDMIKLGDFQIDEPKNHIVYVSSANTETKLEVDSVNPPGIEVNLNEESPGTWRMKIGIPPNILSSGPLAGNIIVRTVGPNPRKVRFPLTGSAYTP